MVVSDIGHCHINGIGTVGGYKLVNFAKVWNYYGEGLIPRGLPCLFCVIKSNPLWITLDLACHTIGPKNTHVVLCFWLNMGNNLPCVCVDFLCLQYDPFFSKSPRSIHINPSKSQWIQVNPSEPKWTQVHPSDPKWTKVNQSEPK